MRLARSFVRSPFVAASSVGALALCLGVGGFTSQASRLVLEPISSAHAQGRAGQGARTSFPAAGEGQGIVAVVHADPGVGDARYDLHFGSGTPMRWERVFANLAPGEIRAALRPVGTAVVVTQPAGQPVPNLPAAFSGPSIRREQPVLLAMLRHAPDNRFTPELVRVPNLTPVPAGQARLYLSIVPSMPGPFEVCGTTGPATTPPTAPTTWFTAAAPGGHTMLYTAWAVRARWTSERELPAGLARFELRRGAATGGAACSGALLGTASLDLRAATTYSLLLTSASEGPGELVACALEAPTACTRIALTP